MICVAVISMLSSIVTQKPLITHLRMCYVCVMHENITQKTVSKWNFTPLCHSLKVKWWKKNRIHALNPWVVESLFRLLYKCKTWTTPIFPPRGSVILFQSCTRLVLIQFLHNTAFISWQPSLSSFWQNWNDISTIVTFLVTNIPQNYSVAEIRASE